MKTVKLPAKMYGIFDKKGRLLIDYDEPLVYLSKRDAKFYVEDGETIAPITLTKKEN